MEELCKKFPKICNCPYKDDIDNDLKKGKSPYAIAQWLKKTDCKISDQTIRRYQKYCIENDYFEIETPGLITDLEDMPDKEEIDKLLIKKMMLCMQSVDFEQMSDNVKSQFILGVYKAIFGNNINATVDSKLTMAKFFDDELVDEILKED